MDGQYTRFAPGEVVMWADDAPDYIVQYCPRPPFQVIEVVGVPVCICERTVSSLGDRRKLIVHPRECPAFPTAPVYGHPQLILVTHLGRVLKHHGKPNWLPGNVFRKVSP